MTQPHPADARAELERIPNPWGEHNPTPKRRRSFDDLVAALAENRPTTFAIHAPAAEEGVR